MNNIAYLGFQNFATSYNFNYKTQTKYTKKLKNDIFCQVTFDKKQNTIEINMIYKNGLSETNKIIDAPDTNIIEKYNEIVRKAITAAYRNILPFIAGDLKNDLS